MLPHYFGKVYKGLLEGKTEKMAPLPIWDDGAFEKSTSGQASNFIPRWMTINSGGRVSSRIRFVYTMTAPFQKNFLGYWQRDLEIREHKSNYAIRYPSPAPFEYPWMKENYDTVISERAYMVWKENVPEERFILDPRLKGIGHDWWDKNHSTVSCTVCRTWSKLNPPSLEEQSDDVLEVSGYNKGTLSWGYFACECVSCYQNN